MLPQSSAAQLGLTLPASPGQEEGSLEQPMAVGIQEDAFCP